jgi:hypothetical protein
MRVTPSGTISRTRSSGTVGSSTPSGGARTIRGGCAGSVIVGPVDFLGEPSRRCDSSS